MIDRILLAPYYLALEFRHFLYDKGIRKAKKAEVPTVGIGNITVGGTGKTPHTELTLRTLLSMEEMEGKHVAVLSRGYRRKSRGFQQVLADSSAAFSGDEPLQIKTGFPEVTVAVDAGRVEGCRFLCHPEELETYKKGRKCLDRKFPPADIIVLDDVFQHRALQPSLQILLIDYNRPIQNDCLIPFGHLRDLRKRAASADVVIVTKCPTFLGEPEKDRWIRSLGIRDFDRESGQGTNAKGRKQTILFTTIEYCRPVAVFPEGDPHYIYAGRAVLFSGIADDTPLKSYLAGSYRIARHLTFSDHHKVTDSDIRAIRNAAENEPTAIVVTTAKDSQRLKDMKKIPETLRKRMFQVPIKAVFLTEQEELIFRNLLKNLV